MYEYYMKEEDIDMIVNKTYKYLSKKKELNDFENIAIDICNKHSSNGNNLTQKQFNVIARIYYSRVHEYKKPTAKMIRDAREKASIELAKEKIKHEKFMESIKSAFVEKDTQEEDGTF